MQKIKIISSKNEKTKKIVKLRDKNKRERFSLFLIEGYREILRAIDSDIEIESLFIAPWLFLKNNEYKLIERISLKKIPIYDCSKEIFKKISYRDRPDGLLAVAKFFNQDLKKLIKIIKNKKNPFLIVCQSIEKPGNLGTILRTADAAAVDAVIVTDPITDVFNPNVVRASIGTLFTVPVFVCEGEKALKILKENNVEIVATTPNADMNYTDVDYKTGIAIAFGTEQLGLSKLWIKNSDILVKIPMFGKVDSLNVAAATTILSYEVIRQRKLI